MQMSSQPAAGNYQIIGLLFLSFQVFGKAVQKIFEENSEPTASSWNRRFLKEFQKKINIAFTINLDQFKGACQGMDQETRATLQTQAKIWANNLFCTPEEAMCLCEWDSGVSFEKAHYQRPLLLECFCLGSGIFPCNLITVT